MGRKEFLERMRQLAKRAGEISLDFIRDSRPVLKPDASVLTGADIAISRHVHEQLDDLLAGGEHRLIDEEDAAGSRNVDESSLGAVPYVWAVDPIDGTRCYSNQIPNFGFSLGVLRNRKPWLGMVYFPALKEMFFCDGENSFFVTNAFTEHEQSVKIEPVDQPISMQSVFFINDLFFQDLDWDYSLCRVMMPSCAIADLCWPAIGRGCGCVLKSHLWDFAGSWPIVRSAGLNLYALSSGEEMSEVKPGLFTGDGLSAWKLKDYHVLSSRRNLPLIRQAIKIINNNSINRPLRNIS